MGKAIASLKDGGVRVSTGPGWANTRDVKPKKKSYGLTPMTSPLAKGLKMSNKFTPQQVRAIKQSPKGELPKFMSSYSLTTPKRSGTR